MTGIQISSPDNSLKGSSSVAVSRRRFRTPSESIEPKSLPAISITSTTVMDSLTELLDSSLKIEESATKASRNVVVPPGYQLSLEIGPSEVYKQKDIIVKENKLKRDRGMFTAVTRRNKHVGFLPQQVQAHGALDLKDCKPSKLTNDIHPLLHHSRFDDCPDFIYSILEPGLRLATLFLTQPICCQFWVLLMKGERSFDPEHSRIHGASCYRIAENVPMTKANTEEVIEYMKRLDDADMALWSFKRNLKFGDCPAYGVAQGVCDYQPEFTKGPINTVVRHNLWLHADFYIAASKFSALGTNANCAQFLRFSFFLAVIICHELAHAIEGAHRRARRLGDDNFFEPLLFDHKIAELGRAWETMTFGGTIHPINSIVDGKHGIATWDWPEEVSGTSLKYTVSMAYIEKLFQMETWQRNYDLKNNRMFHVSRDGAVSIDLNCLTTMKRSEEIRVAKEEESLTDSEPTAKKRDKGKGGREPEGPMPRHWPGKNSGGGRFNRGTGKVGKRPERKGKIAEVKEASAQQEVKPLSDRITRAAPKRSQSRRARKLQVNQS